MQVWFPSPFGVRVLKSESRDIMDITLKEFPSPFGVRVLKLKMDVYILSLHIVSVPFRGSCSEI